MKRFTRDNTEGYTDEQLAQLNNLFNECVYTGLMLGLDDSDSDSSLKAQLDSFAATVKADYDKTGGAL